MITLPCAPGATHNATTERFKREMTRHAGQSNELHAPKAHKYDGVGGFAKNSGPIPVSARIGCVVLVLGVVGFVRLATGVGFF